MTWDRSAEALFFVTKQLISCSIMV